VDSFHPEDGGDKFLQNIGSDKTHTVPHPRRWHSSFIMVYSYCTLSLVHICVILLTSCCVISSCVLAQDQVVFSHYVDLSLKKNHLYPKNTEDFIAGFEKYCTENCNFKKVLTHTKVNKLSDIELNSL
jgi:hypothetical protein